MNNKFYTSIQQMEAAQAGYDGAVDWTIIPRGMWPEGYRDKPDYPPSTIGFNGKTLVRSELIHYPLHLTPFVLRQPNLTLEEFFTEHGKWSEATFGSTAERGPEGTLKHLAKETEEAAEKPYDIMEYADMLLLLCDSTRRAGFTYNQLVEAAWKKLAICKARKWPKAVDGQPVEHIE